MTYDYQKERAHVFSEAGQVQFLSIRDRIAKLIKYSGATTVEKAIQGETGDTFHMLACIDRLVELGEIVRIEHPTVGMTQSQIIVRPDYDH